MRWTENSLADGIWVLHLHHCTQSEQLQWTYQGHTTIIFAFLERWITRDYCHNISSLFFTTFNESCVILACSSTTLAWYRRTSLHELTYASLSVSLFDRPKPASESGIPSSKSFTFTSFTSLSILSSTFLQILIVCDARIINPTRQTYYSTSPGDSDTSSTVSDLLRACGVYSFGGFRCGPSVMASDQKTVSKGTNLKRLEL